MKTIRTRRFIAVLLATGLVAGTAAQAQSGDTSSLLPNVEQQGEVQFLSGGIGAGQSGAMKAAAPQYRLMLTFIERGPGGQGQFLADVPVKILDADGRVVLDTVSQGPYLLANLPAGSYTVKASANGSDKTASVNVARSGTASAVFEWR